MKFKGQFSMLIGAVAILSSCSNYEYVSENDVYMQAPTEINLEEDENDLTSFNAFKAREKGIYKDEYRDPRVNERVRMNQLMIMNAYTPFGMGFSPYFSPYGTYRNGPIGFHGIGMYGNYTVGHQGIFDGFYNHYGFGYSPYGYGYGYNPYAYGYGYGVHGYGYNPYYYAGGHPYYGNQNQGGVTNSQPVYSGKRNALSSSSNRSSSYPKTKSFTEVSSNTSYNVNDQTLGTSRRGVKKSYASSNAYAGSTGVNKSSYSSTQIKNTTSRAGSVHRSTANRSYSPSESARRSGAVQTQRSVRVSSSSSHRGVSSSPSQRTSASPVQSRPQSRSSFSTSGSTRGTVAPSSNRSSGSTNSSSGRRR